MDTWRNTSFLANQSMGTKDICILVVHDDPMYRDIISEMLQNCSHYEVMKFKKISEALDTMLVKRHTLNIVFTDVHQSNLNGFQILKYIEKELKLQVTSMNPHENAKFVSVEQSTGAKLYFIKLLSEREFRTLWYQAYIKVGAKANSFQKASIIHEKEETSSERESQIQEERRSDQEHKIKAIEDTAEQSEEDKYGSPKGKKQRVVWNGQMHKMFLTAIEQLGENMAHPKKILEIMKVPGLTKEKVASHLQKHRLYLKRAQKEVQSTSNAFVNSPPPGFFGSSHSDSNPPERNYFQYYIESNIYTPHQPILNSTDIPVSISNFSCPETSTTTINFQQKNSFRGNNQESLKSTSAINNCLTSHAENNTSFINTYPLVSQAEKNITSSNSYQIPEAGSNMNPLLEFSNTNYSEIPTNASNFVHRENLQSPYTHYSSLVLDEDPQPDLSNNNTSVGFKLSGNGISLERHKSSVQNIYDSTTDHPNFTELLTNGTNFSHQESLLSPNTHNSSLLKHENPQPYLSNNNNHVEIKLPGEGISFEHGESSAQNSNENTTDIPNVLDKGKENDKLTEIPPPVTNDNGDDQIQVTEAAWDPDDLWAEIEGEASSPSIYFN